MADQQFVQYLSDSPLFQLFYCYRTTGVTFCTDLPILPHISPYIPSTMPVTIDDGPLDSPDSIAPVPTPKRSVREHFHFTVKALTTKEGLVGNYDYDL